MQICERQRATRGDERGVSGVARRWLRRCALVVQCCRWASRRSAAQLAGREAMEQQRERRECKE